MLKGISKFPQIARRRGHAVRHVKILPESFGQGINGLPSAPMNLSRNLDGLLIIGRPRLQYA